MAMRNIVKLGDPTLKKHSRTVEKFDDRLAQLIDDMKETMYANDGCGLAAVQVGILKRVVVLDVGDGCIELVNPEIIFRDGEQREAEGCLSIPGEYGHPSGSGESQGSGQKRQVAGSKGRGTQGEMLLP